MITQPVTQIPQNRSSELNSTEKRFPRTLAEAFPQHHREQFIPIVVFKPRVLDMDPDWLVIATCLFALGFLVGLGVGVAG